jgi:hypothetical protein
MDRYTYEYANKEYVGSGRQTGTGFFVYDRRRGFAHPIATVYDPTDANRIVEALNRMNSPDVAR